MIKKYCLFIFFVSALFSCKNTVVNDTADFDNFYKKFHRDTVFQLEHITFPLPGFPSFADSMTIERDDFYWQKENWTMQQEVDFESGEFEQELQHLGNLVIERVFLKEGVFIERRFSKLDGTWKLIYYSDLNFGEKRK